jgi:hypothetical protein
MSTTTKLLIGALAVMLPASPRAQADDVAYCGALIKKYQQYVITIGGHSPNFGGTDGSVAVEQCRQGNTAAGIPVLERKLRDAKVELPKRG